MVQYLLSNPIGNLEERFKNVKFNITKRHGEIEIKSYDDPEKVSPDSRQPTLYGNITMGCDFSYMIPPGDGPDVLREYLFLFYSRVQEQEKMVQDGTASLIKAPELSLEFTRPGGVTNDIFSIDAPVYSEDNRLLKIVGNYDFYAKVQHHTQLCDTLEYLISLNSLCFPSSGKEYRN